MTASARVVVLMSPAEKRALDAKATRAGRISAKELRDLLGVLAGVHAETLRRLDATERKLDDTLAYLQGQARPASAQGAA